MVISPQVLSGAHERREAARRTIKLLNISWPHPLPNLAPLKHGACLHILLSMMFASSLRSQPGGYCHSRHATSISTPYTKKYGTRKLLVRISSIRHTTTTFLRDGISSHRLKRLRHN